MHRLLAPLIAVSLSTAACSGAPSVALDAGHADAGRADAGRPDAGRADSGGAPASCASLDKQCGQWDDGCGTQLTCGENGACPTSQVCDGDGRCSCVPSTCHDLGKVCGSWDNGCGTQLACGSCATRDRRSCAGHTCRIPPP